MRKLTHFWFLFGALAAFAGCSSGEDSLGVKRNDGSTQPSKCTGPNPAGLGCGDGNACPTGMVCDPSACHSSHCSCDETTGGWQCTADCGTPTCVPEGAAPTCEARNPALGCSGGCPAGTICNPDACAPSSCTCGDNGEWGCTRDCGGRGVCLPEQAPKECPGPNPATGCGNGCPSGEVCDPGACKPSACSCDIQLGGWACTADCGFGGGCVPTGSALCGGSLGIRAPEGDSLCLDKPDCFTTPGDPNHLSCPDVCSCVCLRGACFAGTCAGTGGKCSEPPVYR